MVSPSILARTNTLLSPLIFLGNWSLDRVYWWYALLTKNAVPKPKIGFWPQISKFWGKNCTFSSLAAHCNALRPRWSMLLREATKSFPKTKRCLIGSKIWVPKLLLPPKKIRIYVTKTTKFGPKYAFLVIWAKYWHLVACPAKKTIQTRTSV